MRLIDFNIILYVGAHFVITVKYIFRFSPEVAAKRGLSPTEMAAVEAIHRAVEFNPHVPKVTIYYTFLPKLELMSLNTFHLKHMKVFPLSGYFFICHL